MARYKIDCCGGCADRHPACHGHCEKYVQQRAEYDETMADEKKKGEIRRGLEAQKARNIERIYKTCHLKGR